MCNNSAKRVNIVSLKVVKESSILYGKRKISSPSDAIEIGRGMLDGSYREKLLLCCLNTKLDLVLVWALEGLDKIIKNKWNLSKCEISEKYSLQYRNSQSYIERFIEERVRVDKARKKSIFKSDHKMELERFCIDEGIDSNISSVGMKYLHNFIINKYGIEYKKIRIGDKTRYGYIGICFTD